MSLKVSIVTPVYNSEKYLKACLSSVAAQTYENWEHILIDDCSNDKSEEIIKNMAKNDSRIIYKKLSVNSGASAARNYGIEIAEGRYLTFLDSDDLWYPKFIETSIDSLKKFKTSFVFASYKRLDENLEPLLSDFIVPEKVNYSDLLKSCAISCLTAFLDIEVLGKKYMPSTKKRQDFGLWLSYLKEIDYAYGIKEPLAIYRIRKDSLSRNKWSAMKYQWLYYYKIEKLGLFSSVYYLINWVVRGILKYRS